MHSKPKQCRGPSKRLEMGDHEMKVLTDGADAPPSFSTTSPNSQLIQ